MIAAAGIKPSEMIAQWQESKSFLAWGLDRHPLAMRKAFGECWKRVEELIDRHGILTTVGRLTTAYRNNVGGRIYDACELTDIARHPLGPLFSRSDGEEVPLPIGLLLAVHDLVAAVDRIVQFDATKYLSPAVHRQAQRKNAKRGRPNARTREEKLMDIGRELKRRGWIAGKRNQDLLVKTMILYDCCEKDVREAARLAGLTRPYRRADTPLPTAAG